MRKRIGLLKKGVAAVLTACMVAGIIPVMPEATVEVQAAITAPTATIAYATKKELMTIFDIDGTQDTVGKIVFGKNQKGNEQEWYIAGEDKRIDGENVVLFAADYLIEKESFCLDYKDRSYDPGWGCSYLTAPQTVYANHYGGSNLRMILDTMTAKGTTTYFTEAEKNLMNKTTIETRDAMNSTMYATTGKLYLPASDRLTWADMWVGSEDSIAIGTQYFGSKSQKSFWLRTPNLYNNFATLGDPYRETPVTNYGVCSSYAVRPAFDLNLSDVLFASAAPAVSASKASGVIADGTGMKLRFDGNSKIASTGSYNKKTVTVKCNDADKTVTLVVQGKDGTTDWYYTIPVSGTEEVTVTAEEIMTEAGISAEPDLSKCKIWLEKPDNTGIILANEIQVPSAKAYATKEEVMANANLDVEENMVEKISFASAAPTVSTSKKGGVLHGDADLKIRFDGSNQIASAVACDEKGIAVTYDSTDGKLVLVIQGNNGTDDWYYAVPVIKNKTITPEEIVAGIELPGAIDLSECKIWIEMKDATGFVYAKNIDKGTNFIEPEAQPTVNVALDANVAAKEPSITAYALKSQLMSSFDLDGSNDTVGKICLGKNSTGATQEWYIAGKDGSVTGENVILFATSPLITNQIFSSGQGWDDLPYTSAWNCSYPAGKSISQVQVNHYGASSLRAKLKNLESNAAYFSSGEQKLMNATKITTWDRENGCNYTTTDKLYALDGNKEQQKVMAGGNSAVKIDSKYWGKNQWSWFWFFLRQPGDADNSVLMAFNTVMGAKANNPQGVTSGGVNSPDWVQPAFDLNLSSVLFASTAKTATSSADVSGITKAGEAMQLRVNGAGVISSVAQSYPNVVMISPKNGETVSVVIQGNDGSRDWYYSRQITGTGTQLVTADTVKKANSLVKTPDLSGCKVWLEKTGSDGLRYAVMAQKASGTASQYIVLNNIQSPVAATTLDTSVVCNTDGVLDVSEVRWTPEDVKAAYNTSYTASVTLTPEEGHKFTDIKGVVLNDKVINTTLNEDGTLTASYTYPATAKAKFLGVAATPKISGLENGTEKTAAALGLPATVEIVTEDTAVNRAAVTWNLENLARGTYNPAAHMEQTFVVKGTVVLPAEIQNPNKLSLDTTVLVTVSAAKGHAERVVPKATVTYATANELMENFDLDGTEDTVAKVIFGKNDAGNAQEWYIAGKDTQIIGNNMVLFAADSIVQKQKFNAGTNERAYKADWGCTYTTAPQMVYGNHYGGSDLHMALDAMTADGNTTYFTEAEKDYMNDTTITTKDTKNNADYTTTGKLYPLFGDSASEITGVKAWAGSGNTIEIDQRYFGSSSKEDFWLRSPNTLNETNAHGIELAYEIPVTTCTGDKEMGVRPAFTFRLYDVLFASAAPAVSVNTAGGKIPGNTAMKLRHDGRFDIQSIASSSRELVKARYDGRDRNVALVVQGKDASDDWYYTTLLSGTKEITITAEEIKTVAGLSAKPDLSECKIWLEKEEKDGIVIAKPVEIVNMESYADKEALLLSYDLDGNQDTVGKINFGKDSSGSMQEWYVAGQDIGIDGENIILFAADSLVEKQQFEDAKSVNKTYDAAWGCNYADPPGEVYPNHYGASDLRMTLQAMMTADTVEYFSEAEKAHMNDTTIVTKDIKNNCDYTTTEKLYALSGEYRDTEDNNKLLAGSNNKVMIDGQYWQEPELGKGFWLRNADISEKDYAHMVYGSKVTTNQMNGQSSIRPAFNLKLSDVLFASGVPKKTFPGMLQKIEVNSAMNLRFDGSSNIASFVTCSDSTVNVNYDDTDGVITLVIQGHDGKRDWYYTTEIRSAEDRTKIGIEAFAQYLQDVPDLLKCKVWIEKQGEDGLVYAKPATLAIDSLEIADIDVPVAGEKLDRTANGLAIGVESTSEVTWMPEDTVATPLTSYTASVTLKAEAGYQFWNTTRVTINGERASTTTLNADGSLTVIYTFPETGLEVVAEPTADVASGRYKGNQNIVLSSRTEGAVIYYTTDGRKPDALTGTEYTGAIQLIGAEDEPKLYTIQAVAVKDGMADSKIATFTYDIDLRHICSESLTEQPKIDATCTTEGTEAYYKCSCGKLYSDSAATKEILNPVRIEVLKHTGGTAGCTMRAECENCHQPYGEIDANNHIHQETRNVKPSTNESDGYIGDIWCTDCNTMIKEGAAIPKIPEQGEGSTGATNPPMNNGEEGATATTNPSLNNGEKGSTATTNPPVNNGKEGSTATTNPSLNNGEEGATATTNPSLNNGEEGSTATTNPSLNNGGEGSTATTNPPVNNGGEGSTATTNPSLNNGKEGSTATTNPSVNNGKEGSTATTNPSVNNGKENTPPPVGTKLIHKPTKTTYKVTKSGFTGGTVEYIKPCNKKQTKVEIGATVTIDGITYKITSIADHAFENNKKLTTITIGQNVQKIGEKAFYGCKKLKNITIETKLLKTKSVGAKAFAKTYAKATIKVPKSKFKAYKKMLLKKGISKKAKIKKSKA